MPVNTLLHVQVSPWLWAAFVGLIVGLLAMDILLVDKKSHRVSMKEALIWSAFWIALAVAFGVGLAFWDKAGPAVASKYFAGYLLEKSLSVDNLFVFLVIFSHFKVPAQYHHKVLFWGVLGALVMRALFIGVGAAAVGRWHWILWVFGAFLIYTGIKLLRHEENNVNPEESLVFKAAHKVFKVTKTWVDDRFVVRKADGLWVTPLFVIVLIVEATDVVFAVDSIPAVFGVTTDPFIVYTSNIFAILGLRSLFFALEGVMHMFRYLKVGLAAILVLIGIKLLALEWLEKAFGFKAGEFVVLGVIAVILVASILASIWKKPKDHVSPPAKTKRKKAARKRARA